MMKKSTVHAIYLALFGDELASDSDRCQIMSHAFLRQQKGVGWRVVGITPEARDLMLAQGNPKGLQRAHLTDRVEITRRLFQRKLTEVEMFALWRSLDTCVIALPNQNHTIHNMHWDEIDNPDGDLFPAGGIGFRFRKGVEYKFLQDALAV